MNNTEFMKEEKRKTENQIFSYLKPVTWNHIRIKDLTE